jgi:hypothetical protein
MCALVGAQAGAHRPRPRCRGLFGVQGPQRALAAGAVPSGRLGQVHCGRRAQPQGPRCAGRRQCSHAGGMAVGAGWRQPPLSVGEVAAARASLVCGAFRLRCIFGCATLPYHDLLSCHSRACRCTSEWMVWSLLSPANTQLVQRSGALLHRETYLHRYPYDWRTKKPVILRATKQWFASVEVCFWVFLCRPFRVALWAGCQPCPGTPPPPPPPPLRTVASTQPRVVRMCLACTCGWHHPHHLWRARAFPRRRCGRWRA